MKSKKSLRLLDLNRDIPTTAADICALRQARRDRIQDLKSCLAFLSCFPELSASALRERNGPAGSKPLEL
jgi:hypothetical protein